MRGSSRRAHSPDEGVPIAVRGLSKRFGDELVVDDLTFDVRAGRVTGFLGPNGSGKTTTLRMMLGLVRPTAGTATIGGLPYAGLSRPQQVVGAAVEATSFHPGRTARNHLRIVAATADADEGRVDELLDLVGLSAVAGRRVGEFSLGMRQRLGLASALVGDPRVLLLDEPANGLDPEGIRWLRDLMRHAAGRGATVLVSSHVLSEVQQSADDVVIVSRGRLVRACTLADLEGSIASTVVVASPDAAALATALTAAGWSPAALDAGGTRVRVSSDDLGRVGHALFAAGVEVHELTLEATGLEEAFLAVTAPARAPAPPRPTDAAAAPAEQTPAEQAR